VLLQFYFMCAAFLPARTSMRRYHHVHDYISRNGGPRPHGIPELAVRASFRDLVRRASVFRTNRWRSSFCVSDCAPTTRVWCMFDQILRAVRTTCPEALVALARAELVLPASGNLRKEAIALSDMMVQSWEMACKAVSDNGIRQYEMDDSRYDAVVGGVRMNVKQRAAAGEGRVEIPMMALLPPSRLVPDDTHRRLGYLPFTLEELLPRELILHEQELLPTVEGDVRTFQKSNKHTGVVDDNLTKVTPHLKSFQFGKECASMINKIIDKDDRKRCAL
jgi:hypothetical protein